MTKIMSNYDMAWSIDPVFKCTDRNRFFCVIINFWPLEVPETVIGQFLRYHETNVECSFGSRWSRELLFIKFFFYAKHDKIAIFELYRFWLAHYILYFDVIILWTRVKWPWSPNLLNWFFHRGLSRRRIGIELKSTESLNRTDPWFSITPEWASEKCRHQV